jgi:hypothetical protein
LYTYAKLKRFLDENAHIDTVMLSFHYSTLEEDDWVWEESYVMYKIPSYLTLLGREEIGVFARKKMSLLKSVFHPPLTLPLKFIKRGGHLSYKDLGIGGYQRSDRNKLQEDIALRQNNQTEKAGISFYQKEYLLKIAALCKSRNVELILINAPTYRPETYGSLDLLNEFRETYLPDVTYWDYSAFPLPDDAYGDIDHLNRKGAEIFSKYLQRRQDYSYPMK